MHGMPHVVDLGFSRNALEEYLKGVRYWTDEFTRTRYQYILSPCAYGVGEKEREQLRELAVAVWRGVSDLNKHLCRIAATKPLQNADVRFLKLAKLASCGLLLPASGREAIPPVIKVDLMRDHRGNFRIAEVDTYNPRGLGFAALLEGTLEGLERSKFRGVVSFAEEMKKRQKEAGAVWAILISREERFYDAPFAVLAERLSLRGVTTELVYEPAEENKGAGWFPQKITHALLIPESLSSLSAKAELLERYHRGTLTLLYPPLAYLGSKAFLPYLSRHPHAKAFVPKSDLVSRRNDPFRLYASSQPPVLKGVMSSGMKQVIFADLEPAAFWRQFTWARQTRNDAWMVQEKVPQAPVNIITFDERGDRRKGDYYLRFTAYITKDGVLDLMVTGRPDEKVHGAKDCIQLPVIFD